MLLSNGCFYDSDLHELSEYPVEKYPLAEQGYLETPDYLEYWGAGTDIGFKRLLYWGYSMYSLFEKAQLISRYRTECAFFVNTGYDITKMDFFFDEKVVNALKDSPDLAVTKFDKSMLGLILTIYFQLHIDRNGVNTEEIDYNKLLYILLSLFQKGQEFQNIYRKAININCRSSNLAIFFLFLSNETALGTYYKDIMRKRNERGLYTKLNKMQTKNMNSIVSYRKEINKTIYELRVKEKEYADDSQNKSDWHICINCINQLSKEEKRILGIVKSSVSSSIKNSEAKKYLNTLEGRALELFPNTNNNVVNIIENRGTNAPNYLWMENNEGELVLLDKALTQLIKYPYTFNTVIIAYNLFLNEPTEKNLKLLLKPLKIYILKNIAECVESDYETGNETSEESINALSRLIIAFYEEHKSTIDSVTFEKIQNETTLSGNNWDDDIEFRSWLEQNRIDSEITQDLYNSFIEDRIIVSKISKDLINAFLHPGIGMWKGKRLIKKYSRLIKGYEGRIDTNEIDEKISTYKNAKEREIGKRLVVSINAIYILENVIGKVIDTEGIVLVKRDELKKQQRILNKLETMLISKVYIDADLLADSGDAHESMQDYRERIQIDIRRIETDNAASINRDIVVLVNKTIESIEEAGANGDSNALIEIKNEFKRSISKYPDTEITEGVYSLVEKVSELVSRNLIHQQKNSVDFKNEVERIHAAYGDLYSCLPDTTISTLATAELLYSQYATEHYAHNGFDYSSISALYYQAVESTYNTIIWSKYAARLDMMRCDNIWFAYRYRKGTLPQEYVGYLPLNNQSYYLADGRIKKQLTMGTFEHLLLEVTSNKNGLRYFQQYLDSLFGYDGVAKESNDYKNYRLLIDRLYGLIKETTPRRNNASHGFSSISQDDCRIDREKVLDDLESTRDSTMGIIRLFLSLYRQE